MAPHTILFIAANPVGTDPPALYEQARAIQAELERTSLRDYFKFQTRWAAQPLDLLREMVKLKPAIVHFCGGRIRGDAGAAAGGVYFQATDGHAQLVPAKALSKAFDAAGSVKLVVLDACYTEEHAVAVAAHIDCVVGMAGEAVDGALSFAIGLYGGLGEGESVATAFKQGCAAIGMSGAGDPDQPQLRVRPGMDASGLVLTEPSEMTDHGRVDAYVTRGEPLPVSGPRWHGIEAAGNVAARDDTGNGASQHGVHAGGDVHAVVTDLTAGVASPDVAAAKDLRHRELAKDDKIPRYRPGGRDSDAGAEGHDSFVDVAVLTVIPAELKAALAVLSFDDGTRRKHRDGTVYFAGSVRSHLARRDYSVVLGCIGGAGNSGASVAAAHVLAAYRPHALLLMGIAAGMRGKTKIGDVVLSERVVAYEPAALVATAAGKELQSRPDIERLPHGMNQDVSFYCASDALDVRLSQTFERAGGTFPPPPRRKKTAYRDAVALRVRPRLATVASGEKLLRDPDKLYAIRQLHGKTEVGEMEATGLVEVCRRAGVPWLVIRGISDFGDSFKDDRFHRFAACAAAAVLADFLVCGLDLSLSDRAAPMVVNRDEDSAKDSDFLRELAPGPMVPVHHMPPDLVHAYASQLSSSARAAEVLAKANKLRESVEDPGTNGILIDLSFLPNLDYAGPYAYWSAAFLEAFKHGPRMIAALLLVQPDDLFPLAARRQRSALLAYINRRSR